MPAYSLIKSYILAKCYRTMHNEQSRERNNGFGGDLSLSTSTSAVPVGCSSVLHAASVTSTINCRYFFPSPTVITILVIHFLYFQRDSSQSLFLFISFIGCQTCSSLISYTVTQVAASAVTVELNCLSLFKRPNCLSPLFNVNTKISFFTLFYCPQSLADSQYSSFCFFLSHSINQWGIEVIIIYDFLSSSWQKSKLHN